MPSFLRSSYQHKNGSSAVLSSHLLASSRKGHSRASQCEIEAFWKKSQARAGAIESKDLREVRYAAEEHRAATQMRAVCSQSTAQLPK